MRNHDNDDSEYWNFGYETGATPYVFPSYTTCYFTPPEGMKFKEWNTSRDGNGDGYDAGDTVPTIGMTYYAIWEIDIRYLTEDTNLTGTVTLLKATGTKITFDTDQKYITKDIEITVNATTASPSFTGGVVSGTATASATNATISDSTNNSGVSIVAAGSATRGQVTYNGAVGGWVTKTNGAEALAAGSATALTNKTYYINGVTIPIPSSGNNIFNVTVPNGNNDTITFVFKVDSGGNTYIDNT